MAPGHSWGECPGVGASARPSDRLIWRKGQGSPKFCEFLRLSLVFIQVSLDSAS